MLSESLGQVVEIIINYGWLIFLGLIFVVFSEFWMVRIVTKYIDSLEWILLEIKIPKDNIKSTQSMEQVFATVYGIYSFGLKPWEKYVEGKVESWLSFEMTGDIDGVHFYVRTPKKHKNLVETAFFSQYPAVELDEAEDYTKSLPSILPNAEYEVFGTDIILAREDPYPIKTYIDFGNENQNVKEEEDKVDPVAVITEAISKLKPGERVWLQLLVRPADPEWAKKAKALIEEEAGKRQKVQKKGVVAGAGEFLGNLASAPVILPEWSEGSEKQQTVFRLYTPGEQDKLKAMSRKASKRAFDSIYRFVYIDKKEDYTGENVESVIGAIQQFATLDLNFFKPNTKTFTKKTTVSKWPWMRTKRLAERKQQIYQAYINREIPQPFIPRKFRLDIKTSILNIEELASIYHPPTISVRAPQLRPSGSRKSEPPVNLPIKRIQ